MRVLLVNGSPHERGCTHRALTEIADTLREENVESEILWLGREPLGGCIACGGCRHNGECIYDDILNRSREKFREADGFVFGSPVHYAAASGNLTAFMDRLFYSESKSTFFMKPAAVITSARRAGTTATMDQINKYFSISQMPIVSSRYWNMVHGATPQQVEEDKEGLWTMRVLARNMAYLLKCKAAAEAAGIELPRQETGEYTNFIR
ncbi:MAG: flavodoxin family protein [Clostridia bacterium]|nr:flavodoxin family protein [Clostridia bacterium]